MGENKTKATAASVEDHIVSRANASQQADCQALMAMLSRLTKQSPQMWGPSIIGYGSYQYTYESGRTGESPLVGFAIRNREIVIYLNCDESGTALLTKLGKHRMGKSCLYFKQLSDLDASILEQLISGSIAHIRRLYG